MFPLLGIAAWEAFAEGVALAVSVYKAVKGQLQSKRQEMFVCGQIFGLYYNYFLKLINQYRKESNDLKVNTDLDNGQTYSCDSCGQVFFIVNQL